ncbi:hypothetical protein [Streptomyces erythrochromogenes]|uniref:hypothetical protein n=1 Tax=Streptomyces erythrochromogenes TaxID=285574 RepID=UPI00386DC14D|nr:hypothetical protein OG489_00290 [Streptomyces erythrochromogenes]WSR88310.1 hypothetical protein OG489_39670 [Streptomyces erythrochromogenes]
MTETETNERLIRFVSERVASLVLHGAAETLATGVMDLVVTYDSVLPHLQDKEPDYATGVADGLGQALRHIAAAWSHHPDYEAAFAVQTPATAAAWTA